MPKYLILYLLILFNKAYGQEIIFSSELEHNPNNVFNSPNSFLSTNVKVSDLKNYLIIDYTRNNYSHSFIIDENFNTLKVQFKKNRNEEFRHFIESFGAKENHWLVYKGFDDNKFLFSNSSDKQQEKIIKFDKSRFIGAFINSSIFYQLGYNKKENELILNMVDTNLNITTRKFSLALLFKNFDIKTRSSIKKIFLNEKFDEISYQQVNTVKEISRKNKFYILDNKLIVTLNPKKDENHLNFSVLKIDLKEFKYISDNYKIDLPKSDDRFKSFKKSCSYLQDNTLFAIVGFKDNFLLSIIDTDAKKSILKEWFVNDAVNDKKVSQKKINSILKLSRVGLKINKLNSVYYLTLGGYEESSGFRNSIGGSMGSALNSIYSYEIAKSIRLVLDINFSVKDSEMEYHPFEKIEAFRKKSFFNQSRILGKKFSDPNKDLPKGEIQFKFQNKYFYAYFDKKTNLYTIRKFN
ncbi:hypothetical protein KIM67_04715 [Flagellimonas sp. 389]|uniref:hypothetical protein n=1 Tax=Flagellimonas sp. 389 TaxID=2835862 RepID=UPI001BD5FFF5|nr:hypothetical protein [Flagellimonas sp. 389]MBS9461700.1 hypothetical protein [Flagellimonas sp. 389]